MKMMQSIYLAQECCVVDTISIHLIKVWDDELMFEVLVVSYGLVIWVKAGYVGIYQKLVQLRLFLEGVKIDFTFKLNYEEQQHETANLNKFNTSLRSLSFSHSKESLHLQQSYECKLSNNNKIVEYKLYM